MRKTKVVKNCAICGKTIEVRQQRLKDKNYCRECWQQVANPEHCRDMAMRYPFRERLTDEIKAKVAQTKKDNPYHHPQEIKQRLREKRLKETENRKCYPKVYGRHEHRIVAEQMLGRPLKPGEVVHHIDRNKQNNKPENLMVFSSQAEHAKWHKEHDKGGDAE